MTSRGSFYPQPPCDSVTAFHSGLVLSLVHSSTSSSIPLMSLFLYVSCNLLVAGTVCSVFVQCLAHSTQDTRDQSTNNDLKNELQVCYLSFRRVGMQRGFTTNRSPHNMWRRKNLTGHDECGNPRSYHFPRTPTVRFETFYVKVQVCIRDSGAPEQKIVFTVLSFWFRQKTSWLHQLSSQDLRFALTRGHLMP